MYGEDRPQVARARSEISENSISEVSGEACVEEPEGGYQTLRFYVAPEVMLRPLKITR